MTVTEARHCIYTSTLKKNFLNKIPNFSVIHEIIYDHNNHAIYTYIWRHTHTITYTNTCQK